MIVIEGRSIGELKEERQRSWDEMSLEEHMDIYVNQGIDRKEAMKLVARDRGMKKREVYRALL